MQHWNQLLGHHHPHHFAKQVRRLGTHDFEALGDLGRQGALSRAGGAAEQDHDGPLAPEELDQGDEAAGRQGPKLHAEIAVGEEAELVRLDLRDTPFHEMSEDRRGDRGGLLVGQAAGLQHPAVLFPGKLRCLALRIANQDRRGQSGRVLVTLHRRRTVIGDKLQHDLAKFLCCNLGSVFQFLAHLSRQRVSLVEGQAGVMQRTGQNSPKEGSSHMPFLRVYHKSLYHLLTFARFRGTDPPISPGHDEIPTDIAWTSRTMFHVRLVKSLPQTGNRKCASGAANHRATGGVEISRRPSTNRRP